MGNQIYFKIAKEVDLVVLIIFTPRQISVFINVFELLPKNCNVLFIDMAAMMVGRQGHRI